MDLPYSLFPAGRPNMISNDDDRGRTIFVDVSFRQLAMITAPGTNRVTRQLLSHWAHNPPLGWNFLPIYSDGVKFYNFTQSRLNSNGATRGKGNRNHEEISPEPSIS